MPMAMMMTKMMTIEMILIEMITVMATVVMIIARLLEQVHTHTAEHSPIARPAEPAGVKDVHEGKR